MAIVLAAGLLTLAACGKSKTTSSNGAGATTTAAAAGAPTTATAAGGPMLATSKKDAKLGTVLADAKGLTVYTLTMNGKAVACTGACAKVWPPVVVPAGVSSPAGPSGVMLSVATAADGTRLLAAGGLPVYRFVQDKDSGDAYGEGLTSFGGTWHTVKVSAAAGAAPTSGAPATAPATTASSGNGY